MHTVCGVLRRNSEGIFFIIDKEALDAASEGLHEKVHPRRKTVSSFEERLGHNLVTEATVELGDRITFCGGTYEVDSYILRELEGVDPDQEFRLTKR